VAALAPMLQAYPRTVVSESGSGFRELIKRQDPSIRKALEIEFRRARGTDLPGPVELQLDDIGNDGDFRVSTNLARRAEIGESEAHQIIERALLGAAGLEQRFLIMHAVNAVSGFREEELQIVEARFAGFWNQIGGEEQEDRFQRVVAIRGLPDLSNLVRGQEINIKRVLKLRESPDCRDMRKWLRETDSQTDAEIGEQLTSFREALAASTHTKSKSTMRFVLVTLAGLLPGIGIPAGLAATAADRLIFEKLIGRPGPVTFLGRDYPSIFKRPQ
jgi:hypothetical protein